MLFYSIHCTSFWVSATQLLRRGLLVYLICISAALAVPANVKLLEIIQGREDGSTFSKPTRIDVQADGTIYVIEPNGVLTRIESDTITQHSLSGTDRAFSSSRLSGIAMLNSGEYVVLNNGDDNVAVFDDKGKLIFRFGRRGAKPGQLKDPVDVAYSGNGLIYIADKTNNRISVFSRDGIFLHQIGLVDDIEARLKGPIQVAVDAEENVYVLESQSGRISIYDHSGELLKQIPAHTFSSNSRQPPKITAIAADSFGNLYIADSSNGKIIVFDWRAKQVISAFGSPGKGRGQFSRISDLRALDDGHIYIADELIRKIEIYKLPLHKTEKTIVRVPSVLLGNYVGVMCDSAHAYKQNMLFCINTREGNISRITPSNNIKDPFSKGLQRPVSISSNDDYIAYIDGSKIDVLNQSNQFMYSIGGRSGSKDGSFNRPSDLAFWGNQLYVSDTYNDRIQIFSLDGVFLDKIQGGTTGSVSLRRPKNLELDSRGNIYVIDDMEKKVKIFSPNKKLLYQLGGDATSSRRFTDISDISIDPEDNLYVLGAVFNAGKTVSVYNGPKMIFRFGYEGTDPAGSCPSSAGQLRF